MQASDVRVFIPEWNRRKVLCENTLTLLRRRSFPLNHVHVFVAPTKAHGHDTPEWYRYLTKLRASGFETCTWNLVLMSWSTKLRPCCAGLKPDTWSS